ncbi:MAG: hypothetical protein JNG84_03260 [Archangium sp.]|nr:hypothetical protein [Archangium sp.]
MNCSKWVAAAAVVIVVAFLSCGKAPTVCDPDSLMSKAQLCADRESLGFAQEFNQGTFIGQTAFENLQIRNGGVADLTISSVTLTSENAADLQAFNFRSGWSETYTRDPLPGTTIKGNKTSVVEVTFKPSQPRQYQATLTVTSDAENAAEKTFTITGCGVPPDGGISPCYCRPTGGTCAMLTLPDGGQTPDASRCCSGTCTAGNTCQ